jgi:hypothetical protein
MRLDVDDVVFTHADTPGLLTLFTLALVGRHRILVEADGEGFRAWLERADDWSKEVCREAINISERSEATEPAKHHVRVIAGDSKWHNTPPLLGLTDALDLVQRPYRLLVEGSDDQAFLLAMTTQYERQFLETRLNSDWLEIETCCGIQGVAARATLHSTHRCRSWRCSALFDSDATSAGHPSPQSQSAVAACGATIHHQQLLRRSIENYLPMAALQRWSRAVRGREGRRRRRVIRAFGRLGEEQRAHYHLKRGLTSFEPPSKAIGARDRAILAKGFGGAISAAFRDGVFEEELKADGGWWELRPFIQELIARVR